MHTRGNKGISTIIATVLIVLITVAAVTILWAGVSPLIDQQIGQSYLSSLEVDRGGYTAYDSALNKISVRVTRGSDDVPMTGFKIVVTDENGNTYEETIDEVLAPNSAKVYRFNKGSIGTPTSVLVVPIFEVNGDSVEGTPTQKEVSFVDKAIPEYADYGDFGSGSGGGPTCNNDGIKDAGEECDGTEFGGLTCDDYTGSGSSGSLSCSSCTIDSSACQAHYLQPYASNVIGYWTFEDSSMSSDNRYGGSSITCTVNGNVPLDSGKIGTAASFSGSLTDYISCPGAFSNDVTEVTISIWIQADAFTGGNPDYFIGGTAGWRAALNVDNPAIWMSASPSNNWLSSSVDLSSNTEFYNIVYVWDGPNDRLDIYVNYADDQVSPTSHADQNLDLFTLGGSDLTIGKPYPTASSELFAGKIDELVFLDVALDNTQVAALYNNVN